MSRLRKPGLLHDRGEAQRAEDQPDGGEHARHAAAGEQVVDRGVAARRHEAVGHGLVDGLDAVEHDALVGLVDERLDDVGLGEAGEDARRTAAMPKMARNGGTLRSVRTTSSAIGSRLSGEMLNAVARTSRASSAPTADDGGIVDDAEHEVDEEGEDERRARPSTASPGCAR